MGRSSESPLTLNCLTVGLPPTTIEWYKSGTELVNNQIYTMYQEVIDRRLSQFNNLLEISQPPQQAIGFFRCKISTSLHEMQSSNDTLNTTVFGKVHGT